MTAGGSMDAAHAAAVIQAIASGFRDQLRAPILKTPAIAGLAYEDVTFPSEDGVPLEAWFVPRAGSNKLLIVNHPRGFNRYGFPSHIEPWRSVGAMGGNDFEVDFIADLRILHDAGFNVLTYDLRNHGHSGSGNGSLVTSGRYESRDVIGSLVFARSRPDIRDMAIGLFSRCMGCNATIFAIARKPEMFLDVRCLVGVQPVSPRVILSRILSLAGVAPDHMKELDERVRLVTSFGLDDLTPIPAAADVHLPTFLYQVHDDVMTVPADVEAIFENIGTSRKELFWIEGTKRRWDGYTYFTRHPEKMLAWFNHYMG